MEQETLIYIEEKDKNEAAKLAGGFTLEDTLKRAYINALGSELAMKYLAQEEINVSNIYNLHNIYKIREEFDIADVMLPNIHIDVRMIYDDEYIFIPKSHFEYGLTPDIYLVFQMLDDESCVKFLGFFEPKLINKNNHNDKYYFIEKEKLSHPSDLKSYIEKFNGNTTEALSEEDFENGQKLAMQLIDHDITDSDKRNLLKMLLKSSALREDLIEFDNFEWVSYHVATNEDLTSLPENHEEFTEPVVEDEFDIFEQTDDFENDDDFDNNLTDENLMLDEESNINNFNNDLSVENEDNSSEIDLPELLPDSTNELDSITEPDILSEDINLDNTEELSLDNISEEPEQNIEDLPTDIIDEPTDLNIETAGNDLLNEETVDNDDPLLTADENFDLSDLTIEEPEINQEEEIQTDNTPVDKIHLDEFNKLPFDTVDQPVNEEEVTSLDNLDDLSVDLDAMENLSEPETNESNELMNFDTLEERDDIKPVEEEPFKDDETTSFEAIESINETPETEEQVISDDLTTSFDNMELPQDNINISENTDDDSAQTISLDDLNNLSDENMADDESANTEELSEQPISLEELAVTIPETPAEDTSDDFLETLAEDETIEEKPSAVSYENSTVINNQIDAPGEFSIDINQTVDKSEDNDLEKLEILYNQNNDFQDTENNLQFKASLPEKGKKAIALATVVVAALASLLIYSSMGKNQPAEQNNTSILEKNLPKLDEQEIPQENAVLPTKTNTKPKLEDVAKTAAANVNKPKAPVIETPYLDVKKLSWLVPDYVSYNDAFNNYLQTAGKSLKLSLSSDLLLATEYAYSDQIQVNIVLSKEGTIQNANILQSSGSTQIDDIVLRTVNDTLKVVKAPAGVIVGDSIQLTLKIYL